MKQSIPKTSSFAFHRRKKQIQVWSDIMVSNVDILFFFLVELTL